MRATPILATLVLFTATSAAQPQPQFAFVTLTDGTARVGILGGIDAKAVRLKPSAKAASVPFAWSVVRIARTAKADHTFDAATRKPTKRDVGEGELRALMEREATVAWARGGSERGVLYLVVGEEILFKPATAAIIRSYPATVVSSIEVDGKRVVYSDLTGKLEMASDSPPPKENADPTKAKGGEKDIDPGTAGSPLSGKGAKDRKKDAKEDAEEGGFPLLWAVLAIIGGLLLYGGYKLMGSNRGDR